jgi:cytochrome c-type protein NapC
VQLTALFSNRLVIIATVAFVVVVVGWLFAYEPVTRYVLSTDGLCAYCHVEQEYDPSVRLSRSRPHAETPKGGQAPCVDCHLPEGFWPTTYAYTHYASMTDLFGHFRDRAGERAGEWIPSSAARAYRVRDQLFESDSAPCRTCHIESEIKPKRSRGKKAHKKALADRTTCIECHTNLVHRQVELRKTAFQKPKPPGRAK